MSKDKPKITPADAARQWVAKHEAEGLNLKVLETALASVDKKTEEAHALASSLGEVLEARKAAVKELKVALKAAKADRKAPKPAPAPQAPMAIKKPAPKKAAPKTAN